MRHKWALECGAVILKYRMAGSYYFLRYEKGQSLDGGGYRTFKSLKEAKKSENTQTGIRK